MIRAFDFRAPRYAVDLPVHVVVHGSAQAARCTEICSGGMRLESSTPMTVNLPTVIQLAYRGVRLDIPARVVHLSDESQGVQFLRDTNQQREDVARLISLFEIDCGNAGLSHATLSPQDEEVG